MVDRAAGSGSVALCPTSDILVALAGATRCRALSPVAMLLMCHCQCCCNRLQRLESRRSFGDWLLNKRWQNVQPAIGRYPPVIHVLEMGHFLRGNWRRCSRCLVGLQKRTHVSDAVSQIHVDGEVVTFIAETADLQLGPITCHSLPYKIMEILDLRHRFVDACKLRLPPKDSAPVKLVR